MSINAVALLIGVGVGAISGFAGLRSHEKLRWSSLFVAAAVGAAVSVVAVLVSTVRYGSAFAGVHIAYLILTGGIPVAAIVLVAHGWKHRNSAMVAAATAGVLALSVGVYATHIEPFWLRTDEVRADAGGAIGVRIGVLSDFQTTEVGEYERKALDRLLALEPDIVVIPGDFWHMSREAFIAKSPEFAAVLRELDEAVEHVVAVEGNTDNYRDLRTLATGTDVHVLLDEVVDLEVGDATVRIAGLGLDTSTQNRQAAIGELLDAEFGVATILLAHVPDVIYEIPEDQRVGLVVAGHTHGGQFQLPFIGPLTIASDVPRSVGAGGLSYLDGQSIYVSTGVGRERGLAPQMRFRARPSIGLIELYDASLS